MECGEFPGSLAERIASALVGEGVLNIEMEQAPCGELTPFIDCTNNHIPAEAQIANIVSEDDCGNTSLRVNVQMEQWDDLRITPGSFDRPGISDPNYVIYYPNGGGLGVYVLEFAKNDFASFMVQLPHGYKQGSDIYVHLHWTPGPRGNEEAGALVGWKVDYSWANINGTFSDMQTADLSDACDGTDHKHQMTPEVLINGTGKNMSSMLLCNIRRTDGGADDTWSGAVSGQLPLLLEVDFHVMLDSIGSRTHSSK